MKDRIGNELAVGDKVLVALPESNIFGFISQMEDASLIVSRGSRGGTEQHPGRVLVSCVIAIPVENVQHMAAGIVKVYDADKRELANQITMKTN